MAREGLLQIKHLSSARQEIINAKIKRRGIQARGTMCSGTLNVRSDQTKYNKQDNIVPPLNKLKKTLFPLFTSLLKWTV